MSEASNSYERVLLVDDNETDNFISARIIELTGFSDFTVVKNSGKEALDYLKENKNNPDQLPDLIFLDINMPIVNGFIFLYEFEKFSTVVKRKCKVCILSSSDNSKDINKIVNNDHVIRFLTKPLTATALNELRINLN